MASIILESRDKKTYTISRRAAFRSNLIRSMVAEDGDGESQVIPIPFADARMLGYLVMFLINNAAEPLAPIMKPLNPLDERAHLSEWYCSFLVNGDGGYDGAVLLGMLGVGWYLDCPALVDVCSVKIACLVRDHPPSEVRRLLGLPELSTEEEYELRKRNLWIFTVKNETMATTTSLLLEPPEES